MDIEEAVKHAHAEFDKFKEQELEHLSQVEKDFEKSLESLEKLESAVGQTLNKKFKK